MKRILITHHGTHNAGAPISVLNTANGLKKAGYEVSVGLVWPSEENFDFFGQTFPVANLSFVPLYFHCVGGNPNPIDPRVVRYRLWNLWKDLFKKNRDWQIFEDYDLIYVNSITAFPLVIYLLNRKIRMVWHIREHGLKGFSLINHYQRKTLQNTRHLIYLSNADKSSWGTEHGHVIPNWISWEDELTEEAKEDLQNNQAIRLLYVGGNNKVKGSYDILRIARLIRDRKLNVELTIYGWSTSKVPEDLQSHERIGFHDFNPNLTEEFLEAHILLYPANLPHFSRPIVEAMLSRTLVIAKKNASTVEHLDRNKYGILIEDTVDYASKVIEILSDLEQLHFKIKNTIPAAKKYATMKYSRDRNMAKIINVVKKCLNEA